MSNPFFNSSPSAPSRAAIDPQAVSTIKGMINNLRSVQNPDAVLQMLSGKNPLLGNVMRMVGGRNPQQVFYAECQRQGINPEEILNMLK